MGFIHYMKKLALPFLFLQVFIFLTFFCSGISEASGQNKNQSFLNIQFKTSRSNKKNQSLADNNFAQVVVISPANSSAEKTGNTAASGGSLNEGTGNGQAAADNQPAAARPSAGNNSQSTGISSNSVQQPPQASASTSVSNIAESGLLAKKSDFGPDNYQKNLSHIFPMIINSKIIHYIHFYQTAGRKFFVYALSRSERYVPMIQKVFKKLGLPNDLAYLAMVESGFSPTAYSYAGASGMWQFIPSTGRLFGLTINWWVDERRNPVESTYAAGEYLRDLFNKFGSWYLAAAAYNSGELTIERALSVDPGGSFWAISQSNPYLLPGQTRHYVPKIIAAAIIAKDPENFGFHNINYKKPIKFKQVNVPYSVSLYDLARLIGISEYKLQMMNPELLRNVTPPDDPKFMLNIPAKNYATFMQNFKYLEKYKIKRIAPPRPQVSAVSYHRKLNTFAYIIKPGDTLMEIASRYGVALERLERYNNIRSYSILDVGEKIYIPGLKASSFAAKKYYGRISSYRVRPGDSLMEIASRYGVSLYKLEKLNGLNNYSILKSGENIKIPYGNKPKTANLRFVVVRPGMTLWNISKQYGVPVKSLEAINHIYGGDIHAGQRIYFGDATGNIRRYSYIRHKEFRHNKREAGILYYRVQFGDSLYSISSRFHDNMRNIMAANNLKNPNSIYPGEILKIQK